MIKRITVLFILLYLFSTCTEQPEVRLKDGMWYAEFTMYGESIPFKFEVTGSGTDTAKVILRNGAENTVLSGVFYNKDSVTIPLDVYDAALIGIVSENTIAGRFKRNYIENDSGVPFLAEWGLGSYFETVEQPVNVPVSGKWDIRFIGQSADTTSAVGLIKNTDTAITASILTSLGDLRNMDGVLTSIGFELSSFAGISPYLIKADFIGKDYFTGTFYSAAGMWNIKGRRDPDGILSEPYNNLKITENENLYRNADLSFPDLTGRIVSLSDSQFENKVVILTLFGSWCPNCLDEMEFLSDWYDSNNERGVEVVGLAFEREGQPDTLSDFMGRYNVNYTVLTAGRSDYDRLYAVFPQFEEMVNFPITVFIDRQGRVRHVTTGFYGPYTGLFYEEYTSEFNRLINELLSED